MQTPTVGYKLRWKITYGAKDPSGPLDVYFLFSVLLSGERWSLGKSRILTPEAAVSVVLEAAAVAVKQMVSFVCMKWKKVSFSALLLKNLNCHVASHCLIL